MKPMQIDDVSGDNARSQNEGDSLVDNSIFDEI